MKRTGVLALLWLISAVGCQQTLAPNEDFISLHERFHGKYRPVSSVASEAVDANFDGKPSTDMLVELRDLATTDLRIDINGPSVHRSERFFGFYHAWPEQYVRNPYTNKEPVAYDSLATVNYNWQAVSRQFDFDKDIRQMQLKPDNEPLPDPEQFAPPKAVTIEAGDRVKIINSKRLYTRSGWKTVEIVTVYKRYTTVT
ncbi:hypothetical protein [Spirosoma oryzicola]|uniref:hypothetical protein n=1 Tax=Spirosoma oryzicola TaxID=2898794 RepID=UPI001E39B9EF|nr:hypothetical protein [Spirosoma oryzicola]UHG89840.1 hypothetical protein LQ777_16490 [Spirosoma oryzicola]